MGNHPSHTHLTPPRHPTKKNSHEFHTSICRNALSILPIDLSDEQFRKLSKIAKIVHFTKNQVIVDAAKSTVGLYVILEGVCTVIASNDVTTLGELRPGDFFGEIGLLYDTQSTAIVKTSEGDVKTVLFEVKAFHRICSNLEVKLTLKKWIIQRRYLDVFKSSEVNDTQTGIIFECLREAPIFCKLSTDCCLSIAQKMNIDVHPSGSILRSEGDNDRCGYLLLRGAVYIGKRSSPEMQIGAGNHGILFAETGLFMESAQTSCIITSQPSVIATINRSILYNAIKDSATDCNAIKPVIMLWKHWLISYDQDIYKKFGCKIELDALRLLLRQSEVFKNVSTYALYMISLNIRILELRASEVYKVSDSTVIVIIGQVEILSKIPSGDNIQLDRGEISTSKMRESLNIEIKACSDSVVGILSELDVDSLVKSENIKGWPT